MPRGVYRAREVKLRTRRANLLRYNRFFNIVLSIYIDPIASVRGILVPSIITIYILLERGYT